MITPQKRIYNCTQALLYSICLQGWEYCRTNIKAFQAFKGSYTTTMVDDAIAAVNAAEAMKTLTQRNFTVKSLRRVLEASAAANRNNWKKLKLYITAAVPKEDLAGNLLAAGSEFYPKAAADNWSALNQLLDLANKYITDNQALLVANQNMPGAFIAEFATASADCSNLTQQLSALEVQKMIKTNEKLAANQAIYQSLMTMFRDAQNIFENESIKSQFIFSHLLELRRGSGSASLKGTLTDTFTGRKLAGVKVHTINGKYSTESNSEGRYKIGRIAAGTYTFIFECPGYEQVEKEITFKTGTAKTIELALNNLMLQSIKVA